MNDTPFISVSELARNPREAIDAPAKGLKTILRNNQPIAYLLGVDHPLANLLGVSHTLDEVDTLERAFRNGLEEPWQHQFMETHGVVRAKGANTIERLIGIETQDTPLYVPGTDHHALWEKDGVPVLYTMHVYDRHMDTLNALRDFCIEHGLVYRIERRSWYNPGVSTLIVIEKRKERR